MLVKVKNPYNFMHLLSYFLFVFVLKEVYNSLSGSFSFPLI